MLDTHVRAVPDFPEPGVVYRDITPLLADGVALRTAVDALAAAVREDVGPVDAVIGVEARGFILGAPVAVALGAGFVPVRKQGKLPHDTHAASYDLEYGSATLEIHTDAVPPGARVVLLDDVLATGGTLAATVELLDRLGADVAGAVVLIELPGLGGRARTGDLPVTALHAY